MMSEKYKRIIGFATALLMFTSVRTDAFTQRLNRNWWESDRVPVPFFIRPPVLSRNPHPGVPSARIVEFTTNKSTRAKVVLQDGANERTLYVSEDLRRDHSFPLLGLRAGRTETIFVHATDAEDNEIRWPRMEVAVDPLPDPFPAIDVSVTRAEIMEPGVTLFNLTTPSVRALGYVVAVNERGEVVWYYISDKGIGDARRLRNGNLLLQDAAGVAEIDMLGNTLRRWRPERPAVPDSFIDAISVATDQFHHEVYEMASGNFLSLSLEVRRFGNYPTSETDEDSPPGDAEVVGDIVLEYRPDGTIINQWPLLDILDPMRIGFGSLGGIWNSSYPEIRGGTRDWSHGNAVIHDASDNSLIVSLRHQDAVIKIDRASGSLIWILGDHTNWKFPWSRYLLTPDGALQWPFHQHAPEVTPHGTLLLFDNGNFRRVPFDDRPIQNFSRVVEYSIDATNRTIRQLWSYGPDDELFFSGALGDVDWLPERGNILMTDGFRVDENGGRFARIAELTHTTPARKVFEIVVKDSEGSNWGWRVYRSERLPSLYGR